MNTGFGSEPGRVPNFLLANGTEKGLHRENKSIEPAHDQKVRNKPLFNICYRTRTHITTTDVFSE